MNPLLDTTALPRFAEIKPEHVTPAVDQVLAENRALIVRLLEDGAQPDWDNLMRPLEDANERLSRVWGPIGHLNAVMNSPALREVYNANLPKVTQYFAELGQNLELFNKVKALRASPVFETLSAARKRIVENDLRDFRLGGAELADAQKTRFLAIQEEHSSLSSRFSDNLLDATNAFERLVASEADLSGLPEDALHAARDAAEAAGKPGWLFTLKAPSYLPLMQFADNRALREEMYRAYSTRAAEFGKPELDNTPLMAQLLRLRAEEAALLDFGNAAELSLATKMAETPQQVLNFLRELAQRARPFGEKDLAELRNFSRNELGLAELNAWDVAYASEKLRERRYAFSEQEVKQYFPEDAVLAGMFRVTETLFGVSLRASTAPVWHETVRFFDILDRDGKLVGQFYLDLYARASKRGGAWMDDAVTRRRKDGGIQTPVAYLNCNFSAPVGGKPAVFTHDEVITLFHEFGHGLHHLLTKVEDLAVSGINGVEWDAVELPSQFMENFCWEWSVLLGMTRHVDSGATLPRELFDKMLAAKNFQSGLATLRQIEFALFDMRLHSDFDPNADKTVLELLNEVRQEVAVLIPPAFNRFPNSFSHIFAGGYSAGYYSYKWAEVLSADAYSLFEEMGVLNPEAGARFRREVLSAGGHRPAMQSFVAFRGREPRIDALLRHNGLVDEALEAL
jgi:oligopeptidase A